MSSLKTVARLSLTLLLITACIAGMLAGVNAITRERIAQANEEKKQAAIAQVLPGAGALTQITDFSDPSGTVTALYRTAQGYAVQVAPVGFAGAIDMMVGVDLEGKVTGVVIISHSETAGLGAVAAANTSKGQAFRDQYIGAAGALAVNKDGGTVDAISSATITSRAVTQGVNNALACVQSLGKGA